MRNALTNAMLGLVVLLGAVADARGQFKPSQGRQKSAEDLVAVSFVSDTARIAPGQTFHLAIVFEIEPHWHIYWVSPGASGLPTQVDIIAPEGFVVGEPLYTRPQAFGSSETLEGLTYGYEKNAVLFVPITAPVDLKKGSASFQADILYLVCKSFCLMGNINRSLTLETDDKENHASIGVDPILARAKDRLPQALEQLEESKVAFDGKLLTVRISAGDSKTATLYPIELPGITYENPKVVLKGDFFIATVEVEINPDNALGEEMKLVGVVGLGKNRDDPSYMFELSLSKP